jgi:Sigma-70 region 2
MTARCSTGMDRAWSTIFDTSARVGMTDTEVRDDHPQWSRLMAAAQDGDAGACQKLLHDITPLLRRVAARRLDRTPAADVEDVVQDVLLSVHAVRHTYGPARPFLPRLMAIARYRLADAVGGGCGGGRTRWRSSPWRKPLPIVRRIQRKRSRASARRSMPPFSAPWRPRRWPTSACVWSTPRTGVHGAGLAVRIGGGVRLRPWRLRPLAVALARHGRLRRSPQ